MTNVTGRIITVLTVGVLAFGLTACGGSEDTSSNTVSMSEEGSEPSQQSSAEQQSTPERFQGQQSRSRSRSGGSVDPGAVFEETGVYPTKIQVYQSGFAQLTLNGELTVYSIKVPEEDGSFPTWPKDPSSDRGQDDLIYFESFDLKKALNQALVDENTRETGESLEITDMRTNAYESGSLRGFVDVTFNGAFTVGAKVMESDDGYWLAWPQQEEDGEYYNLVQGNDELNERILSMATEEMDL